MKKEIKSKKLVELLKERKKVVEEGHPLYDEIEEIVSKVISNNMSRIASCSEMWKYLRPYIDQQEYKETNGKLEGVYRKLQRLEYKMNRLKEKTLAIVNKEDIKLGEFEEISSIELEDDKAMVKIVDKIESYKQMLREKK